MIRAKRWSDWALGIDGVNELSAQPLSSFLPFVDTSEIIEYVLPTSLLASSFPTRLDLSLSLLFRVEGGLFVFGPHATELNVTREGWQDRMRLVRDELKILRDQYEKSDDAKQVGLQITALSQDGRRNRAADLVALLRDYHRWIFAAWRVPSNELGEFFDSVLAGLMVPSALELELPDDWSYRPNVKRVDEWMERLESTEMGRGEPGPNLVDAYALDQLEQAALARNGGRLPILFTHSRKILDAILGARRDDPDFFRVDGISLVQPPHVALVLQLRADADETGSSVELAAELERQRDRCQRIVAFVADLAAGGEEVRHLVDQGLYGELNALDEVANKWDALQKVRQRMDPDIKSRAPLLEELERVLEKEIESETFEKVLKAELDKLINELDKLQEKITARSPIEPKAALDLDVTITGEITAWVRPTFFNRTQKKSAVPSATYPTTSFSFRDPEVIPFLTEVADLLERLKKPSTAVEKRKSLTRASASLEAASALSSHPEYYLLLAVVCLAQERWLEASTIANRGIRLIESRQDSAVDRSVHGELLLARANAVRAHVLATRVEIRTVSEDLLNSAVKSCMSCLNTQTETETHGGSRSFLLARCLRELAVILGSSCEAVFGLGRELSPLNLSIDSSLLSRWIPVNSTDGPRVVAAALARRAYEIGSQDPGLRSFFLNTHLYAMTELDRSLLDETTGPQHEAERIEIAATLEGSEDNKDPNFVDSVMWHKYILSLARRLRREPWEDLVEEASNLAQSLDTTRLAGNRYYQRLVELHKTTIIPPTEKSTGGRKSAKAHFSA